MRTTKPISTISYNSEAYLEGVLNALVKAKKVAFWAYIRHIAEEDEHKNHIHLYIEPNGKVDTMDLAEMFCEVDFENPSKPLKCVDWRSSKWDDWYLYAIHDEAYLRMKFEERKYHYAKEDVVAMDEDELETRAYGAMHSDVTRCMRMHKALMDGMTADKMAYLGAIVPAQAFQMSAYQQMFYRGQHQVKHGYDPRLDELRREGFEPVDEVENPYSEN